jgi:hypothetical protein
MDPRPFFVSESGSVEERHGNDRLEAGEMSARSASIIGRWENRIVEEPAEFG